MKNIIKNSYLGVVGLLAVVFATSIVAMSMTPQQMERAKVATQNVMTQMKEREKEREKQLKRESMRKAGMYFIYENDTDKGVFVDKIVVNMCKSLANMIEDLGGEVNEIPLSVPFDTIKLGFDILSDITDISKLSPEQLIDVANLFNFLDVPADKMQAVLVKIKKEIVDKSGTAIFGNEVFKNLHPDLQKELLADVSDHLKDCIIKKYAKDRRKPLVGHLDRVTAVAFNPDGTKIISSGNNGNLILWNAKTYEKIQKLEGLSWGAMEILFSPDSKKIVVGWDHHSGGFIVWDINDLNNIIKKQIEYNSALYSLAFNPDGKSFAAGYYRGQNNLILWDINDFNNITSKQLFGHPYLVKSVAFSPDGKYLVSASASDEKDSDKKSLILWDISDLNANVSYDLTHLVKDLKETIEFVSFFPDSKKFISYGSQLILWDVSNANNIHPTVLISSKECSRLCINHGWKSGRDSFALSHDGKKFALSCSDGFILLNINNPNNRIVIDNIMKVCSMALSPDGRQIITGGEATGMFGSNLILLTLVTDQEETLLNQIKNYTADQIRLIYQLCLQSSKKQSIKLEKGSEEEAIFKTLPEDMQKLLTDLFLPQGWLSGWWS